MFKDLRRLTDLTFFSLVPQGFLLQPFKALESLPLLEDGFTRYASMASQPDQPREAVVVAAPKEFSVEEL